MGDPAEERDEVKAAEAAARAAIDRLVNMVRNGETFGTRTGSLALGNLGHYIANSLIASLTRCDSAYHRLALIRQLDCYGSHAPEMAIEVLGGLATSDPEGDVREAALDVRDDLMRHDWLELEFG